MDPIRLLFQYRLRLLEFTMVITIHTGSHSPAEMIVKNKWRPCDVYGPPPPTRTTLLMTTPVPCWLPGFQLCGGGGFGVCGHCPFVRS